MQVDCAVQFVGKMGQLNGASRLRRSIRGKNGAIEWCKSIAPFNLWEKMGQFNDARERMIKRHKSLGGSLGILGVIINEILYVVQACYIQ